MKKFLICIVLKKTSRLLFFFFIKKNRKMHLNNTDQQHYLHVYVYSNFNTIDMLNMKVKFEIFRLVFPSPFSKKKNKTNKQNYWYHFIKRMVILIFCLHFIGKWLLQIHFLYCVDGHIGVRRFEGWKKICQEANAEKKIKVLFNKRCIHQCVHTISVNCNQYKTKMNIKKWFTHKI